MTHSDSEVAAELNSTSGVVEWSAKSEVLVVAIDGWVLVGVDESSLKTFRNFILASFPYSNV